MAFLKQTASSDEVLVNDGDDTACRDGAATEDPDAIAGAVSSEDMAMLLLLKLKEVSVSLIDQTKNRYIRLITCLSQNRGCMGTYWAVRN